MRKTTNYDMFKLLDGNRSISKNHVDKLVKSIGKKNMLKFNPIMVDKNMVVTDGQHRLEACKILGLPVYYVVEDEKTSIDKVMLLNDVTKSWTIRDFINAYVKEGNQNFIILKEFQNSYGLPVTVSVSLLTGNKLLIGGGQQSSLIKSGKFKVTTLKEADEFASRFKEIYDEIKKPFARTRTFIIAVAEIMKSPDYDHQVMVHKIKLFGDRLKRRDGVENYMKDMEKLFNLKSKGDYVYLYGRLEQK